MTKEEIAQITPLSITTTNNPVFVLKRDFTAPMRKRGLDKLVGVKLKQGTKLRLLGCKLDNSVSPFMYKDSEGVLLIDNTVVKYTDEGGPIGDRFKGNYETT